MTDAKRGVDAAAEMLAQLDEAHREKLLQNIAAQDPRLAQELSARMYRLSDLTMLDGVSFDAWMRAVPPLKLRTALRGAPPEIWELFKSRMTARGFANLQDEVLTLGPQRSSDVDRARVEIVRLAHTQKGSKV